MEHKGYKFCVKRSKPSTGTIYYSCVKFRKGCEARLISREGSVEEVNSHSCREDVPLSVVDVREEMRQGLEELALNELNVRPGDIWLRVMDSMRQAYPNTPLMVLPKYPGINVVKNARTRHIGHDQVRAVESVAGRTISDEDGRPFLQANVATNGPNGKLRRMMIFGHPDLIRILRYTGLTLFIDGTFKIVPARFAQCLIVMVHDSAVDVYIPTLYLLLEGKDEDTYWSALHWIIMITDRRLEPAAVTCDFELALINAVVEQFPRVHVVGCLFHFKQALRRKLIDLKVPPEQIADAMTPGKLDVLTIIPKKEITEKGIRFVRSVVDETGAKKKWDTLWAYFTRTWMLRYDPDLWNVDAMVAEGLDIRNRTNNPLEKYNRDFAERFGATHPSLVAFVAVAKAESLRYVRLCDDIRNNRASPPVHEASAEVSIPQDYIDFE